MRPTRRDVRLFDQPATPRLGVRASGSLRRFARPLNDLLERTTGARLVSGGPRGVKIDAEWVDRFRYFDRLMSRIEHVDGDVVECGVAGGESLAMFASLVRARAIERTIWGFDSWSGLPQPSHTDVGDLSQAAGGMFGWASIRLVEAELRGHGFDDVEIAQHVRLERGDFADTLSRFPARTVALLHVDADLYESYRTVLECLWPRLAVGGLAAFDEYEELETWPGARRAVDEFLGRDEVEADLVRDQQAAKWYAVKRS